MTEGGRHCVQKTCSVHRPPHPRLLVLAFLAESASSFKSKSDVQRIEGGILSGCLNALLPSQSYQELLPGSVLASCPSDVKGHNGGVRDDRQGAEYKKREHGELACTKDEVRPGRLSVNKPQTRLSEHCLREQLPDDHPALTDDHPALPVVTR